MRAGAVTVRLVPSLVVLMALVAGCATPASTPPSSTVEPSPTAAGIESLTAVEILAKATAALDAAPSFRLKATTTAGGTSESDVVYAGENFRGKDTARGQVTEYVRVGNDLYVKAGAAFWTGRVYPDELALVADKWVKVNASKFGGLVQAPSADSILVVSETLTKGGVATVDGEQVIVLKGKESTVYVAARGEPYPVRLEFTYTALDTAFHSVLNFSEFGTVTAAIGPPTGDIVDRSSS